jgi:hypothetical protein
MAVFRNLALMGLLFAALPAGAVIAPSVLLQRSRVAGALSEEQRTRAHQLALSESSVATPGAYEQAVEAQLQPEDPPLAFELYAGVAHLELREKIQSGYASRLDALRHAELALRRYIGRCHDDLRVAHSESVKVADIPERDPRAVSMNRVMEIETDSVGLRLYRLLPWPETFDSEQQHRLLLAAREDEKLCEAQQKQVEVARTAFQGLQHDWSAWVARLANRSAVHNETWLKQERAGKAARER